MVEQLQFDGIERRGLFLAFGVVAVLYYIYPLDRFYRFWLSVVVVLRSAQYQLSRILTTIVNFFFSYQYKNKLSQ